MNAAANIQISNVNAAASHVREGMSTRKPGLARTPTGSRYRMRAARWGHVELITDRTNVARIEKTNTRRMNSGHFKSMTDHSTHSRPARKDDAR